MKSVMTLDQSNCRPRVLHRNFRSKTDAAIELGAFPLGGAPGSSENLHVGPFVLLTRDFSSEPKPEEKLSSSTKTFLSLTAMNKLCIDPYIALWFVLLGGCGKLVKLSFIHRHCSSRLNAPGIK